MTTLKNKWKLFPVLLFIMIGFTILSNNHGLAEETIQEVKNKIDDKQNQILQLQKEIEISKKKIKDSQGKERTLKSEITKLNYQEQILKKTILEKEVLVNNMEKTISSLDLSLQENTKEQENIKNKIANSIIFINRFSDKNPLEILILEESLSKFDDTFNTTKMIQDNLKKEIQKLKIIAEKTKLLKENKEKENNNILREKEILTDQKKIALKNKSKKNNLLKQTKNQEKYYQKLLTEKQKKIKAFYQEINSLEEKLKILIDPASLPTPRRGLFDWPVPTKNLWITQYYGVTAWRKKYANGTPHRGLDFGVVIGTPMYAISDGVVSYTGDNTKTCEGVQYGKWITVDQQNNLSSLYAHLSLIKVKPGQKVKKGDIIGYSGNTGYSTGPHLHFAIFATKGLRVQKVKHRWQGRCYQKVFRIPVVASNAYVNPIKYMPEIK